MKSGNRTKAHSLRQFQLKYSPERALKTSGKPLTFSGEPLINVPLYYIGKLGQAPSIWL